MLGMLSAERAVLAALQTVGCVLFVLDRVVVSLLAFIASECNLNSCACSHCSAPPVFIYLLTAGIASLYGTKSAQKESLSSDR
jgi:hypothetical protein